MVALFFFDALLLLLLFPGRLVFTPTAGWIFYPVIDGVYQEYLQEQAEAAAEAAAAAAEES